MEHNEHNEMDDRDLAEFEQKLRLAMRRREAPLGMKQRVLARAREGRRAQHGRWWMVQRIAASAVLAAVFGGFAAYRQYEERKKGEEARQQVLTALRITGRTLDRVSDKLADDGR